MAVQLVDFVVDFDFLYYFLLDRVPLYYFVLDLLLAQRRVPLVRDRDLLRGRLLVRGRGQLRLLFHLLPGVSTALGLRVLLREREEGVAPLALGPFRQRRCPQRVERVVLAASLDLDPAQLFQAMLRGCRHPRHRVHSLQPPPLQLRHRSVRGHLQFLHRDPPLNHRCAVPRRVTALVIQLQVKVGLQHIVARCCARSAPSTAWPLLLYLRRRELAVAVQRQKGRARSSRARRRGGARHAVVGRGGRHRRGRLLLLGLQRAHALVVGFEPLGAVLRGVDALGENQPHTQPVDRDLDVLQSILPHLLQPRKRQRKLLRETMRDVFHFFRQLERHLRFFHDEGRAQHEGGQFRDEPHPVLRRVHGGSQDSLHHASRGQGYVQDLFEHVDPSFRVHHELIDCFSLDHVQALRPVRVLVRRHPFLDLFVHFEQPRRREIGLRAEAHPDPGQPTQVPALVHGHDLTRTDGVLAVLLQRVDHTRQRIPVAQIVLLHLVPRVQRVQRLRRLLRVVPLIDLHAQHLHLANLRLRLLAAEARVLLHDLLLQVFVQPRVLLLPQHVVLHVVHPVVKIGTAHLLKIQSVRPHLDDAVTHPENLVEQDRIGVEHLGQQVLNQPLDRLPRDGHVQPLVDAVPNQVGLGAHPGERVVHQLRESFLQKHHVLVAVVLEILQHFVLHIVLVVFSDVAHCFCQQAHVGLHLRAELFLLRLQLPHRVLDVALHRVRIRDGAFGPVHLTDQLLQGNAHQVPRRFALVVTEDHIAQVVPVEFETLPGGLPKLLRFLWDVVDLTVFCIRGQILNPIMHRQSHLAQLLHEKRHRVLEDNVVSFRRGGGEVWRLEKLFCVREQFVDLFSQPLVGLVPQIRHFRLQSVVQVPYAGVVKLDRFRDVINPILGFRL
mmetsp:Transcript_23112/g.58415  ORF Transcript_23112/g.58415 Transcript_23112/m.58415 type:complete len:890 (+) Transcript_23112:581-3250(+)